MQIYELVGGNRAGFSCQGGSKDLFLAKTFLSEGL